MQGARGVNTLAALYFPPLDLNPLAGPNVEPEGRESDVMQSSRASAWGYRARWRSSGSRPGEAEGTPAQSRRDCALSPSFTDHLLRDDSHESRTDCLLRPRGSVASQMDSQGLPEAEYHSCDPGKMTEISPVSESHQAIDHLPDPLVKLRPTYFPSKNRVFSPTYKTDTCFLVKIMV